MRRAKVGAYCPSPAPTLVVLVVLLLGYGQISNMTTMLSAEFQKHSNFCVKDPLQLPPGTALMMLDANKIVAAASSRNPTLASAMTRLQRCAFSGSWEV
ncbi:hypothetical protein CK203_060362 [Vitis vinifera]|uniref:Uncharacterized protein n=1 Tax=Vitis vinifera TaxID=29760 RepID=A0A438FSG0_VITVI|nr:hypothetical protein CK203_060362 [Vitis vinifera]